MEMKMNKKFNLSRLSKTNFPVGIYILMVISLVIYFALMSGTADLKHFLNVLRSNAPLGIAAIGQTIVLLIGGVDLSIGAVITMTNIIACMLMEGSSENIPVAIAACFGFAILVGLVNGLLISKVKMPAFLATLAMSIIIQGIYLIMTGGAPGGMIADEFRIISDGWILSFLPISFLIWMGVWLVVSIVLNKTVVGSKVFISGGNPVAGKLSGIKTDLYLIGCYIACAVLGCVAGLILSAYVGVASPGIGDSYILSTIACTVIGGTAFSGGEGSVEGTFAGVMILVILQTVLSVFGVPNAVRQIIQGVIILVIVIINQKNLDKNPNMTWRFWRKQ